MTPEDFNALFDTFTSTAFRLEARPIYAVGAEQARIDAFQHGEARPERSVRTSPWMARIATSTVAGKSWTRVRVVDEPLNPYQRYQLRSYVESQAVGEQILIARRSDVGDLGPDFWLFDADTPAPKAVLMHYDVNGRIVERELVDDPDMVESLSLRKPQKRALHFAVPLNEFLVSELAVARG